MVSAFRALNEVIPIRQGTGMVIDWRQAAGTLLVGGDSRVIKVWDAQTETQGLVSTILSVTIFAADEYFLGFGYQFRQPCHLDLLGPPLQPDFHRNLR